jgi:uncharacterized membrane protein
MISPKLVSGIAAAFLVLCLTACAGFSSGKSAVQAPPADFSVNINPSSATVAKGGKTTVTASIGSQGSFSGMVQLEITGAPVGVSANLSSTAVNGSGSPTLTVSASSSAATGTYNLTLWGASGNLSHSTNFSVVVSNTSTNPDFSLSAAPASQSIAIGQNTSFTVSVAALNGFTGSVSLTASGLPSGMQAVYSPASITTSGTATLNISTASSTAAGTYTLTIAGASGTLNHSTTVSVVLSTNNPPPDFSISTSPTSQTLTAGNSATFTVSIAALTGFTGTVGLAESGMPAGMLASCSPSSITGTGSCALSVSTTTSTAAGTYTLTVTGTSGTLSHSASISVKVNSITLTPDFTFSASPSAQSVTAGNSTTFTASVSAQNGFTGSVALSASGMPSGVTASFAPASITTSGSSTLTLTSTKSAAAGTYSVTLTAKSGTITHNTNVSLVVSAAAKGAAMNVLMFPGATSDPFYKDFPTYIFNNASVTGATLGIEWAGSDQGPSAGSSQYDWTYPDAQLTAWVQAGKKVNFVVWANADNASNTCGPEASYGTNNTGNCAIPTYVWTALGASNTTTCATQFGTQQMPNYLDAAFQSNYQKFMAAMIQHYTNNPSIGYIRFGLGHGGESLPVANWNDTTTACGQAYVNTWGLTIQNWESYLASMLNYEGSLDSSVQLMVGVTPMGNPGTQVPDFAAPVAVQNNIGFGSQGLELSDVNNCPGSTADWCDLFAQFTGQVPLELQTYAQSCSDNTCTTGSLVNLIPFAASNHATIFELYYQDWLTAFDPNYPGYYPAYQPVIQAAAGQ